MTAQQLREEKSLPIPKYMFNRQTPKKIIKIHEQKKGGFKKKC